MTITRLNTVGCEQTTIAVETPEERIPLTAIPKLAWAAAALFLVNVAIGFFILITPSLDTDPYGREVQAADAASSKMSPFTEVVDMTPHKARLAAKARPVTFVPVEDPAVEYTAASLDMPRATVTTQLDIPRASRSYQQLDLPVRTENAVYRPNAAKTYNGVTSYEMPRATYVPTTKNAGTDDIAPRRTSERPKNLVVIN